MKQIKVSRIYQKKLVVALEYEQRLLGSTVTLITESGERARYLVADAPDWVRQEITKGA